jgi:hypothetical protein
MKPINEQINAKYVIQAKKLAQITRLLHQILPFECQNHVVVANIRNHNLVLIADSPVWTTRLRQLSPQILQFIRENSSSIDTSINKEQIIHHIQISTRYHASHANNMQADKQTASSTRQRVNPQISEKTAELLSQSANSIKHQQLKNALLKIASHGNNQTKSKK